MSIANKVLASLVAVTALVFFYLAARTLQTHVYWQKSVQNFEQALKKAKDKNEKLIDGEPGKMGIRQVQMELDRLLLDRRRTWADCEPKVKIDRNAGTAEVTLTIEKPDPNGIADNTVLYAFDQAEVQKRGRYLGQFKVTKVAGKDVILVPTSALSTRELDRLAVAKQPWMLYEIMPQDSHEAFAGLSDEEKKAVLPPATLQEYLKDGKPAAKDDPPQRVEDGKYVRQLRDYQVAFDADTDNRTLMDQQLKETTQDTALVKTALDQAQQQEAACKTDVAAAEQEKARICRERDVVGELAKKVSEKLAVVQAAISKLLVNNQAMAGQIAQQQLEAARRIDQRTRAMAQTGTGGG